MNARWLFSLMFVCACDPASAPPQAAPAPRTSPSVLPPAPAPRPQPIPSGFSGNRLPNLDGWDVERSGTSVDLSTICASGLDDIYIGGDVGTLLHSNGDGVWTPRRVPTIDALGVFCFPGELYVFDARGRLFHSTDGAQTFVLSFDQNTGTQWPPARVFGPSSDVVFMAGLHAKRSIDHGVTWTDFGPPPSDCLEVWTIWGSSADDVYLAGSYGGCQYGSPRDMQLAHTTDGGASWTFLGSSDPCSFQSSWGSGPNDVWLTGCDETILHTADRGISYQRVAPHVDPAFDPAVIWGTSANDVYALAGTTSETFNYLLHTTDRGTTWEVTRIPICYGGWSPALHDVYLACEGGLIFHRR